MDNIAISLSEYSLRVTEPPTVKTRQLESGELEPVVNKAGEVQFVVAVFAKPRPVEGQKQGKGYEIRVNLGADPGDGFAEGMVVELLNPRLNLYAIADRDNPRLLASAGLWFKADGLKPAGGVSQAYAPSPGSYADDET